VSNVELIRQLPAVLKRFLRGRRVFEWDLWRASPIICGAGQAARKTRSRSGKEAQFRAPPTALPLGRWKKTRHT